MKCKKRSQGKKDTRIEGRTDRQQAAFGDVRGVLEVVFKSKPDVFTVDRMAAEL